MSRLPPRRAARPIALFLLTLTGSAIGRPSAETHVVLVEPVAVRPLAQLPAMLAGNVENLAQIDPDDPVGPDSDLQTLSLFGREDLIAPSSRSYTPTHCAPLAPSTPALAEITRRARQTRIVIINESHERSEHRGFCTGECARRRYWRASTKHADGKSSRVAGMIPDHVSS